MRARCAGGASTASLLLGDAGLETRVRELERSLAPASALEMRLSHLEKATRATTKQVPQDVWGKLWNAVNRVQYRVQVMEHAVGRGMYAGRLSEMLGEGGSQRGSMPVPMGGVSAQSLAEGAFEAAAASPPRHVHEDDPHGIVGDAEVLQLVPESQVSGRGGAASGRATGGRPASGRRQRGSGSRQGDALLAALPGLIGDDASSSVGASPMPSCYSTRPPSATHHRPTSASSGAGGLRERSAPSITPLDGGGGPPGHLGNDFHLGVVSQSASAGQGGVVSWH